MKNIKILDCTLRDGGYYNRWDFSENLVSEYLNSMRSCSIDYVELGFRSLNRSGFKGPCAYTSDDYINDVVKFSKPNIAIMINGSEILEDEKYSLKNVKNLFPVNTKSSKLKLVRIACHLDEILKILPICNFLKKNNYKIAFNLMQISEISLSKIKNVLNILNDNELDIFYIADSLGSLDENQLIKIIETVKSNWKKEIGLHAHDNMEKALSNAVTAVENGVTWIDSTVNGMGRGPGNVKTETALLALDQYRSKKFELKKIINLIEKFFVELKIKHKWGTNPYYYYAAQKKIHPTFIQTLLGDNKYNSDEIISKIKFLSSQKSRKFSSKLLHSDSSLNSILPGNWQPTKMINKKEVLILGTGPGLQKYKAPIEKYIKKRKPFVMALNIEKTINEKLIDARAACHPVRILSDYGSYKNFKQTFILPLSSQNNEVKDSLKNLRIKNFGFSVRGKKFKFFKTHAISPFMLAFSYALAISNSGKASSITLAGFDGYSENDSRNSEMNELFRFYFKNKGSVKVISITPTKYKIDTKSVFSI